jgi:hypothetical protein
MEVMVWGFLPCRQQQVLKKDSLTGENDGQLNQNMSLIVCDQNFLM